MPAETGPQQGLEASVKRDRDEGLIRVGPLARAAAWLALEAFLGRPR